MAGVAEDADLGRGESGLPQDRADLVVAVVEGEPFPGEGALGDRRHVLAELVAQGDAAVRRQDLAYPPQVARRVCPEVQDVAGQDEAGGRLGGHLLDIAGDQGQAAVGDGGCVAAPGAFQRDG
jgi:hypothetical protein